MGECMEESSEIDSLKLENRNLQAKIDELERRLEEHNSPIVKCGYLHKHRPWALRFLDKPWDLRFFSLTNTTLSYWKSESQAAGHPRGKYNVENDWRVRVEEPQEGKRWIISISDGNDDLVLRLSAGSQAESNSWMSALASVGCQIALKQGSTETRDDNTESRTEAGDETSDNADGLRQRRGVKSSEREVKPPTPEMLSEKAIMHMLRPAVPVHKKCKESPLSSDAIFKQSHAGLFNLCIVLLVAVNSRLIIENLMKYGLLIRTEFLFSSKSLKDWPLLMCGLSLVVFPLAAFFIEKLKTRFPRLSENVVLGLHSFNLVVALAYPIYVIERFQSDLMSGVLLMLITVTGWLKLVSYAHTISDIRAAIRSSVHVDVPSEAVRVTYPDNITISNLAYFMAAPTLTYQMSYPRTARVRKGWVLRQLGKWVVFNGLMGFIVGQYMNPIIRNSTHPLKGNYLYAVERVLKLSVPTLYVWLGFFYCFFHLWLNVVAEVLRFGDREFYKDWWNAKTIDEYWRMWNMPVHRWLVRHVYFPCLRIGIHKQMAILLVFVISGIFHEIVIAVPCHMLRGWAFLGIMFQVPLVLLTNTLQKKLQSSMVGNMIFWFFFCIVGQPMCVLLYYHDVVNRQQQQQQIR